MEEVFRHWGFSRNQWRDVVGSGRLVDQDGWADARPEFGRVRLGDELIDRCGPWATACADGWWGWLVGDGAARCDGEPVAWFASSDGTTRPIVTRTQPGCYAFSFRVDDTIRFIQNERFVAHAAPLYVRLGVRPCVLPAWLRSRAFKGMSVVRRLGCRSGRAVSADGTDPSVDAWRWMIREVVVEHTGEPGVPLWPDGKRFAAVVTFDVDTAYSFRHGAMTALADSLDGLEVKAAWMTVTKNLASIRPGVDDLHAAGHEIGFHGTLHDHRLAFLPCHEMRARLREGMGLLGGYDVKGFRSPSYLRTPGLYGALNGSVSYDMSMHDRFFRTSGLTGVREGCGTCMPFVIAGTDVLEIPTTVPEDWNLELAGHTACTALDRQRAAVGLIADRGGVANVVHHPEPHLSLRREWLAAFFELVAFLSADHTAWVVRPREVDRHWRERMALIDGLWGSTADSDRGSRVATAAHTCAVAG
ncbi:MAG: polysaccharide deacetylase family protein [Phycisphaerae bacterium]